MTTIDQLGTIAIWFFFGSILLILAILIGLLYIGYRVTTTRGSLCPYCKKPLMLGIDLPKSMAIYVEEFMKTLPQQENPPIDFTKAAICNDTGQIFTDCVGRGEIIRLDWDFLAKRYKGNWVSWGSLPEVTKAMIRLCHRSPDGFQFEHSSPKAAPREVDAFYGSVRPGPLYVDVATKTFLGWQRVPGTYFEVLVVKKPDYDTIDETL